MPSGEKSSGRQRPAARHRRLGRGNAGISEDPASNRCRLFLEEILLVCLCFAATQKLELEWKKHGGLFARHWVRSMFAKKKLDRFDLAHDERLRAPILTVARSEGEGQQMLKDAHLIEAAVELGSPVVSLDDRARNSFKEAARVVRRLRSVVWVNPTADEENPLEWLRNGAQSEAVRCLGFGVAD
jgi:hypothetical protein